MIIYVGIDVGKRNHEAGIINGEGKQIGKTLRISNTMTGFQCLNDFIQDRIKKIIVSHCFTSACSNSVSLPQHFIHDYPRCD